jgi:hypothetical protein
LNGIWLVSPSEGYRDAYAVTPQVMACRSPGQENMQDLRNLPGLALLHEGLSSIDYNEEQDEFIRAEKGPYGNSRQLLLKADGLPLFDASRYWHQRLQRQERPGRRLRPGTLCQRAGRAGVPRARRRDRHPRPGNHPLSVQDHRARLQQLAPKVFPGRKLLAITEKGEPRIFSTKASCCGCP